MRITSEMSYQMDGVIDSTEAKRKWGFSGIALRSPLKPVFVKQTSVEEENDEEATTPTSQDSRISSRFLTCPPAPKKRKPSSKIHQFNNVRRRMDFFNVPDLETVFIRRVDKA
ncbi:hypothetical protein Leryth_022063 [Lithospermum erythrorhizon]|uniref:Uncharacterized protein n=1 Tax=Lithospermum erythrorhizon TaxID=34254 RepID=A0AAV3NPB2_LITER|nr:hypothetical protein Leryth_022063 [Lithospermum erythrorhizon]